jgi:3'-phosphoadenosine 5'-phosphosulfate sulfotransferase (PAPS reductase)/FAD synthetase
MDFNGYRSMGDHHEAIASWLAKKLAHARPNRIIEVARNTLPGRLAVVSSFGIESAVLLKFVAEVDRSLPILFLDTLWLFKETLAYRDRLLDYLGLTDVRTITPTSVGCVPCTSRSASGTPGRDGRWSGLAKTECGIHARR